MGLIQEKVQDIKKTYLSITDGNIVYNNGKGHNMKYSSCEGVLEGIYQRERTFGGERVVRWYIDLRDGDTIFSICFPYVSGTFKSIVLALANDKDLSNTTSIRIEPYKKGNYTKIKVFSNGTKLDWITKELPEVREVEIGGRVVKDDSKRMEYICGLCTIINERLIGQ